jgi:hypothetical protein
MVKQLFTPIIVPLLSQYKILIVGVLENDIVLNIYGEL